MDRFPPDLRPWRALMRMTGIGHEQLSVDEPVFLRRDERFAGNSGFSAWLSEAVAESGQATENGERHASQKDKGRVGRWQAAPDAAHDAVILL